MRNSPCCGVATVFLAFSMCFPHADMHSVTHPPSFLVSEKFGNRLCAAMIVLLTLQANVGGTAIILRISEQLQRIGVALNLTRKIASI